MNKFRLKYLFDTFYTPLCLFGYRYVNDMDVAEDMAQVAFIKCWENLKDIDSEIALKAYLYKITRNECLNYIKHRKVEQESQNELSTELYFQEQIMEGETYMLLKHVICQLSPQGKRIIELSLQGLKNPEIALRLKISVHTVKAIKQKAYKSLRKKLSRTEIILLFQLSQKHSLQF